MIKTLPRDKVDRQSFDHLFDYYQRHSDEIIAYAYHFTRNREDAYDALQEAFCLAMENLRRDYREIENPRAWLLKITRHALMRRQNQANLETATWVLASSQKHPSAHFANAVLDSVLTKRIEGFVTATSTPIEQEMYILRHYHDLNLIEIANITNQPKSNVQRILTKITERIQERFSCPAG